MVQLITSFKKKISLVCLTSPARGPGGLGLARCTILYWGPRARCRGHCGRGQGTGPCILHLQTRGALNRGDRRSRGPGVRLGLSVWTVCPPSGQCPTVGGSGVPVWQEGHCVDTVAGWDTGTLALWGHHTCGHLAPRRLLPYPHPPPHCYVVATKG